MASASLPPLLPLFLLIPLLPLTCLGQAFFADLTSGFSITPPQLLGFSVTPSFLDASYDATHSGSMQLSLFFDNLQGIDKAVSVAFTVPSGLNLSAPTASPPCNPTTTQEH